MPRRILIFIQSREVGGVETQLMNLIRHWPRRDDRFIFWCNRSYKGRDFFSSLNMKGTQVRFPTMRELMQRLEAWPAWIGLMGRWGLNLLRPFIFLASVGYFYSRLTRHSFDVVFSDNGGYPAAELCLSLVIASRLAKVPERILLIHSCPSARKKLSGLLEAFLDRWVAASCTRIVTVSQACRRKLSELRFPSREIDVIYNGISAGSSEMTMDQRRQRLGVLPEDILIGAVGDYEPLKGHAFLIRAFAQLVPVDPHLKLVLVGSGDFDHAAELKKLVRQLGIEQKIVFTGYLENASELMACFHVLAVPSISFEGFGLVALEAMLRGVPVVGTRVGGIPEVIGDAGVLVPPEDAEALAGALEQILFDSALRERLVNAGKSRCERFSPDHMAMKYYKITDRA